MIKNIRFHSLQEQAKELGLTLRKSRRGNYYELASNLNRKVLRFKTLGEVEGYLNKLTSSSKNGSVLI